MPYRDENGRNDNAALHVRRETHRDFRRAAVDLGYTSDTLLRRLLSRGLTPVREDRAREIREGGEE